MSFEQAHGHRLQGFGHRRDLGEDVDAVLVFLDHALQSSGLAFDALEAFEVGVLFGDVAVRGVIMAVGLGGCLRGRGSGHGVLLESECHAEHPRLCPPGVWRERVGPSSRRWAAAAAHITAQRATARVAGCRVICTKVVVTKDMALSFRRLHRGCSGGVGWRACMPRPPQPFGCLFYPRGYPVRDLNRRNRKLLLTTNTDENAIAAPASIGLSSPAAAKGRAATL